MDQQILRCLQLGPRAPFALIAEILATSEQTVARRYRRLRRAGVVRVLAVVNPRALGESDWMVRVECRPNGAAAIADALAQRPDVSWVALMAGGSEVSCALRARSQADRDDLLVRRLPRSAPVLRVSASMLLHLFMGGSYTDRWGELRDLLDDDAERRLTATTPSVVDAAPVARLDATDEVLLGVLASDGRASYTELAAATGLSEGRVNRRLAVLLASGAVFLDVDFSVAALGFTTRATVWLTVAPGRLDAAGRALADAPEVAFAAAITGRANLIASVTCRDTDALYVFVTETVGRIEGVQAVEVSPVMRAIKQAGALVEGTRLID